MEERTQLLKPQHGTKTVKRTVRKERSLGFDKEDWGETESVWFSKSDFNEWKEDEEGRAESSGGHINGQCLFVKGNQLILLSKKVECFVQKTNMHFNQALFPFAKQ